MSFTDYEKYHIHDFIYNKTEVDNKIQTAKTDITTDMTQNFLKVDGTVSMTGNLNMNNQSINNLPNQPASNSSATSKHYVDTSISNLKSEITSDLQKHEAKILTQMLNFRNEQIKNQSICRPIRRNFMHEFEMRQ